MYLEFYGLAERPFSTTPDPKFLYLTSRHREALAQLTYGVAEDQGFIVLTGAIGTGKTTLLHSLRSSLDGNVAVAFISSSMLPFEGLLEYMLEEFGVGKSAASHVQRLIALNNFLVEQHRARRKTVLILDEAQNLSAATLEQVRLLSNFERSDAKLLQILLVGQPELRTKLALRELRQLRQRIALDFSIEPLSAEETRDYIHARLRIAGAGDRGLFTERAIRRIAEYSRGIPRIINILCHHCLLTGYADQRRRIEPDVVEDVQSDFADALTRFRGLLSARGTNTTFPRWALGTFAAIAAAGLGTLAHVLDAARAARGLWTR